MPGSKALVSSPPGEEANEVDHLVLLDSDSQTRKIFLAYTMRIPWARKDGKPLTREDTACFLPGEKKKA
jgi:hypothetical protein